MGSSEEIEVWAEEEKSEVKDPGINLDSAIKRDLDGLYLEMLAGGVEGLQVGKFLTLSLEGCTKQRSIMTVQFFAEPDMDDDGWADFLGKEPKQ